MNMESIINYAPAIYFDRNEPFFPVRIGVTELKKGESSPSMRRLFEWEREEPISTIIEYAIYFDYDIQHLYELEHVWVYVGEDGQVVDCEASFHGFYLKGLLRDRSNIEDGTHVALCSQPGKHAFLPKPEYFDLLPDLLTCTSRDAGAEGLLITDVARGRVATTPEIDQLVRSYLQSQAFSPSLQFEKYELDHSLFVPWAELYQEIPERILARIKELEVSTEQEG